MNKLVEEVAREIRRNKFARNGRSTCLDETLPLTDGELSEARSAALVVIDRCARLVKSGWLTADAGVIGDADYGAALCEEIEQQIKGLLEND